jgi:hemolysin activation/secretion protein
VFDAGALNRYRNYLNRQSYLGGDSRLRGYPSTFFVGKDVIVYNLEFRSRPLQILSCQLGAAAFYDVGHVANGFSRLHPRQAVGVGFRVLFPQLDRVVFRGDVGFPLARPLDAGVPPFTVSIAFEQAFSVPSIGGRTSTSLPTGWLGQ